MLVWCYSHLTTERSIVNKTSRGKSEEGKMTTSGCLAVVIALVVIQVVNGQGQCGYCRDNCYKFEKDGHPPECMCPNSCKKKCPPGEVCRLFQPVCIRAPCDPPPVPYCVDDPCRKQRPCNVRCAYGLQTDRNGCPLCKCCPKPTQD